MKIKRILLLMSIFLFVLALAIIPNKVLATEMSEEFKNILNDEGELVVTDTTMYEDKVMFLWEYLLNYGTSDYSFAVNYYNEEDDTCSISITHTDETHTVPVVYEEKYSDEFKTILKDGKIELPTSSKNFSAEWIETYLQRLGDENYFFEIASYYDYEKGDYIKLINEDNTKATVVMRENGGSKSERHIIEFVKVTEQSENYKKYLNEDGKLVVNGIKPSNEMEFVVLFELLIWKEDLDMGWGYIAEDFSSCDFTVNNETHTVEIVYNYDSSVKSKLQSLINNFPEDIEYFTVQDMELINYWVNTIDNDDVNTLAGYSGELKSYINNYNVKLIVDTRAGWDTAFMTARAGMSLITHNDIAYYASHWLGAQGKHIIYVPNETGDSKDELIAAAQKRINEYLGDENIVTVSYAGKADRVHAQFEYEYYRDWWEIENPNMTLDEFIAENYPEGIDLSEPMTGIENLNANDDVFKVTVKVGDIERSFNIFIKKDSSKMILPTYATADMKTNVEISTESSSIPLDTQVQANKLTSGTEYERIVNILEVEDNATYDLKLYSNSLKEFVTKLEDGTFEVKIPIPEELEGKTLIVYYVDENDNVTEHEVTVKDGFASFETDHFSTYVLAEKVEEDNNTDDTDSGNANTGNPTGSGSSSEETNNNHTATGKNPQTGDNIILFVAVLVIAVVGILTTTILKKHKNK